MKFEIKKQQSGFTLIELVVVIIILGILAATALPRYADMQIRARVAKLNGAFASVRAASALAHAQCLTQTTPTACDSTTTSITMEGVAVALANQYPAATGIATAAGLSTSNPADFSVSVSTTVTTIAIPGATAGTCEFTFTEAAAGLAPTFAITATTCN